MKTQFALICALLLSAPLAFAADQGPMNQPAAMSPEKTAIPAADRTDKPLAKKIAKTHKSKHMKKIEKSEKQTQ